MVFRVFLGISRDFAEIPEFCGSATARNIRSPDLSMNLLSLICCIFMAYLENYTEELLSIHEHQVEVMKNYYEENKNIFKLVEKREALFKTMEEFEVT